jgi:hypothetical protein
MDGKVPRLPLFPLDGSAAVEEAVPHPEGPEGRTGSKNCPPVV